MSKQASPPNEMSEILAELLEYGGIICENELPELSLWKPEEGRKTERLKITTLEMFMRTFCSGKYQVEIKNPHIEGIDPERFSVETFIVEVTCKISEDGSASFSSPCIHTDFEEIMPSYTTDSELNEQKVKDRSEKMGKKIEGALTILSIFTWYTSAIKRSYERA